jgi:hypothetical protein
VEYEPEKPTGIRTSTLVGLTKQLDDCLVRSNPFFNGGLLHAQVADPFSPKL